MATQTAAPKAPPSKPDAKDELRTLPMPQAEKRLGSSPNGLTQTEAAKRLTQYGPNEIEEKKTNPLLKFLSYFWGPIPWMIEAAVILSAVVRHWPDFGIIFLLLLANAVVGFWEERQAGNAIEALKAKLATKNLSVNNMLHCFPVGARMRTTEKAIAEGQTGLLGSIGCVLAEGGAARARAACTPEQKEVPASTGRWAQAQGSAHGVRGDRVRAAHRLPVEGLAQGAIRQCQCDPQTLSGMGGCGTVPCFVAGGAGRVRRYGGIAWRWQSVDGTLMKAPLAQESVGPNPTDRGKKWEQADAAGRRAWRPAVDHRDRGQSS